MEQEFGRNVFGKLVVGDITIDSFDIVPNSFADMITMNTTNSVTVRLFDIISHMLPSDKRKTGSGLAAMHSADGIIILG